MKHVLVTGASGYIGSQLVAHLASQEQAYRVVATDVREVPAERRIPGVTYKVHDIRNPGLDKALIEYSVDTVVHLAAIVMPTKKIKRETMYEVDVVGTCNLIEACITSGVKRFITTSSGAAYGYHKDNPEWLRENDPLRGNYEFPYAYHKLLVEDMLEDYRDTHPGLSQTILRVGTILGKSTQNQISALFEKPRLLGIAGTDSPFVIIWDRDLVRLLEHAILAEKDGIYNVAGDGALGLSEMADIMDKPCIKLPAGLVKTALWIGKRLGLTPLGPEQVRFLQYRPVLANEKLKTDFGFTPEKSTREVFEFFLANRDNQN